MPAAGIRGTEPANLMGRSLRVCTRLDRPVLPNIADYVMPGQIAESGRNFTVAFGIFHQANGECLRMSKSIRKHRRAPNGQQASSIGLRPVGSTCEPAQGVRGSAPGDTQPTQGWDPTVLPGSSIRAIERKTQGVGVARNVGMHANANYRWALLECRMYKMDGSFLRGASRHNSLLVSAQARIGGA